MSLDPLKRSRQRQGPSLAFHTIGVQGYFGSVQPPTACFGWSMGSELSINQALCPRQFCKYSVYAHACT